MIKRKKVGIALGSGGAKGAALVGVLKILEKYKIPIDAISGSSIGSLVGAFYAYKPDAKELEKITKETAWKKLLDYTFPKKGLIKGEEFEKFLRKKLDNVSFEDLKIPLYVSTFDLENKRELIFSRGDVSKAVHASCAIPGVFIPVVIKDKLLVDGGVVDPLPVQALRKIGCDVVIGVNLGFIKEKKTHFNQESTTRSLEKKIPGILDTIQNALRVMESRVETLEVERHKPDVLINLSLPNVGLFDDSKIDQTIRRGEAAARKKIIHIKRLI
ncbi:Patatin-like phospholipase [uncultured archaeon]|nr:Patatin-like phospholipase [uncultured archaeon]